MRRKHRAARFPISGNKLSLAKTRVESILGISEDFILFIAESGIETPDTPIIEKCCETAAQIGALFEAAVTRGEIGTAQLFDENYRAVPGTDPIQHMTQLVALTDRLLPAIQEPLLKFDPRITFCAAVDRNGYLPTHNIVYSRPQGPDPVWNAANCRNGRIFSDRTGLRRPFQEALSVADLSARHERRQFRADEGCVGAHHGTRPALGRISLPTLGRRTMKTPPGSAGRRFPSRMDVSAAHRAARPPE